MGLEVVSKPASPSQMGLLVPKLTRKSSLSSNSSGSGDDSLLQEQISAAVDHTKLLLSKLNEDVLPIEKNGNIASKNREQQFLEEGGYSRPQKEVITHIVKNAVERQTIKPEIYHRTDLYHKLQRGTNTELLDSLNSLVDLLEKSQQNVRQLKLKNLLLSSNLKDIDSRKGVEMNLSKHLYEKVKLQLNIENQELKETIRLKDTKISKYRHTIIEKNKQINKLMRILNDTSSIESRSSSLPLSSHNRPNLVIKNPRDEHSLQRSDSSMLDTLGILASRVLSEENESAHSHELTESDNYHSTDSSQSHLTSAQVQIQKSQVRCEGKLTQTKQLPSMKIPSLRKFSVLREVQNDQLACIGGSNSKKGNAGASLITATLPTFLSYEGLNRSTKEG
ncbi:HFL111Cp [Eremothecium sinecaudum]|uniref:HFL111Cp n=1 Tax=Eremothecium sinecaudum TaxID=45286 RepID=A0A0X8HUJ3_9SACH|nr:HFL111Cp [Eremothecium sinecaudum]AMD21745.1 HFL111Cp [Eremothecium sinecaudum]